MKRWSLIHYAGITDTMSMTLSVFMTIQFLLTDMYSSQAYFFTYSALNVHARTKEKSWGWGHKTQLRESQVAGKIGIREGGITFKHNRVPLMYLAPSSEHLLLESKWSQRYWQGREVRFPAIRNS